MARAGVGGGGDNGRMAEREATMSEERSALDDLEQWLSRQLGRNCSVNTELARALLRVALAAQAMLVPIDDLKGFGPVDAAYVDRMMEMSEAAEQELRAALVALEAL